ncbi:MAG: site-specific integrase [Armatimonadetes bacterium]|nr:site-specific integrase [Armatimonadota bacterium]
MPNPKKSGDPLQLTSVNWQQAVETFLWQCQMKGFSSRTVELYKLVFDLLDRFHAENFPCLSPCTCPPEHIQAFIWFRSRTAKPVTVHGYWRVLRTFFNWLVQQGLRDDNPILKVPQPKVNEPLPKTVTAEHFAKTISALDLSRFTDLRDTALFCLAFDSGARLSELLSLRVGDIDLTEKFAKVKGKGGKERLILFGRQTAILLSRYLTQRALILGQPSKEAFLFVCQDGRPMNRRRALFRWHLAQKRANLKPLPFHGLRHGFARAWLLRGGDAFSLQMLLGHKSPEVTQRYVTLWGTDLQKLHSEKAPVDSIALKFGHTKRKGGNGK